MIDEKIEEAIDIIHICYMDRHVKHRDTDVFFKHEKTLRHLHWIYRKTRQPITTSIVQDVLLELDVKTLYWLLNL